MSARRVALRLATVAVLGLMASAPVVADEVLWEGARFGDCALSIDLGAASLEVKRARGRPSLAADGAGWTVQDDGGEPRALRLTASAGAAPDPRPLRLRLPPRCALELDGDAGSISVAGPQRAALRATTRTGDITFYVEPASNLNVSASTSGDLTVDFDLDLDYLRHSEPSKRGTLVTGSGGTAIELGSKRGAVRVLRAARRGLQGSQAAN